ncbi:unnamed protein product, partial [Allacma fusca]
GPGYDRKSFSKTTMSGQECEAELKQRRIILLQIPAVWMRFEVHINFGVKKKSQILRKIQAEAKG